MLEIGERIKKARRAKGMTQQAFADAIGLKRNTVATYEMGKSLPSDRTITDICRAFDVSDEWLRTGEGKMFVERSRDEELSAFFGGLLNGQPDFKRRLISVLSRLDESEWELLEKMAEELMAELQKEKADP